MYEICCFRKVSIFPKHPHAWDIVKIVRFINSIMIITANDKNKIFTGLLISDCKTSHGDLTKMSAEKSKFFIRVIDLR